MIFKDIGLEHSTERDDDLNIYIRGQWHEFSFYFFLFLDMTATTFVYANDLIL